MVRINSKDRMVGVDLRKSIQPELRRKSIDRRSERTPQLPQPQGKCVCVWIRVWTGGSRHHPASPGDPQSHRSEPLVVGYSNARPQKLAYLTMPPKKLMRASCQPPRPRRDRSDLLPRSRASIDRSIDRSIQAHPRRPQQSATAATDAASLISIEMMIRSRREAHLTRIHLFMHSHPYALNSGRRCADRSGSLLSLLLPLSILERRVRVENAAGQRGRRRRGSSSRVVSSGSHRHGQRQQQGRAVALTTTITTRRKRGS